MSILIAAMLVCPRPLVVGNVPEAIIERADFVCRRDYNGCAVKVEEVGDHDYVVKCKRRPMPASRIVRRD